MQVIIITFIALRTDVTTLELALLDELASHHLVGILFGIGFLAPEQPQEPGLLHLLLGMLLQLMGKTHNPLTQPTILGNKQQALGCSNLGEQTYQMIICNTRTTGIPDAHQAPAGKLADQVGTNGGADPYFLVLLRIVLQTVQLLKRLLEDNQFFLAPFENRLCISYEVQKPVFLDNRRSIYVNLIKGAQLLIQYFLVGRIGVGESGPVTNLTGDDLTIQTHLTGRV
ncbi:hypothetical protein SDC9_146721 [bioreactor metagenome]|uniref:Uncharacterized protein n=1 Tax=bioreactor metagenome TaxID=1076179 RepID=A0A645EDW3_9ZZZZ